MRQALSTTYLKTLASAAAVFAGLAGSSAEAAPAMQDEPRVSIVLFPDVAGVGSFSPSCPGCDGAFTAADALLATADPLPAVDLQLRDDAGMSQTATTSPLAQGRQAASFQVPGPGDYEVELLAVPAGWFLCPNEAQIMRVAAADFDPDTGLARVRFPMTRGCAVLQTGTPPAEGTATATLPATEPAFRTATPASTTRPFPTLALATPVPASETPEPTQAPGAGSGTGGSTSASGAASRGSIRGLVYEDRDGDGALDPDEPGVAGVGVRMTGGGPWFAGTTAPDGSYEFPALSAGTYEVAVDVPAGRLLTTVDRHSGIVVGGNTSLGNDFGLAPPGWRPSDRAAGGARALPQTGFIDGDYAGTVFGLAALAAALGAVGALLERRRNRRAI